MNFELLTVKGPKYSGEVTEVTLTTAGGQIGILPHHEPLTAIAMPGPVVVRYKGGEELFATFGGLLEVTENHVRLLADEAEHADDLIHTEIEAALAKAKQLEVAAKDKHELAKAQEMVDREEVRLGVARMRRRPHRDHPPKQ